ncbi:hypothetical protein [Rhizobium sp. PAMB 3182]
MNLYISPPSRTPAEIISAARKIADYAEAEGVSGRPTVRRASYEHLGATFADAVLQAGLNYETVVRPRVIRILNAYPDATTTEVLFDIVREGRTAEFLNWSHPVKTDRFARLVTTIYESGIANVSELRSQLRDERFSAQLQTLNGIGPKTVDYMACLVGIESIAVDRHIRTYAGRAGLEGKDYDYLKWVFCYAADLLSVSRREFDAWVWQREASRNNRQLTLGI